jgi:hypothetical protein
MVATDVAAVETADDSLFDSVPRAWGVACQNTRLQRLRWLRSSELR